MDKTQRPGAVVEVDAEGNPYDNEDSIEYIIEEEMPKSTWSQEIGKAKRPLIADRTGCTERWRPYCLLYWIMEKTVEEIKHYIVVMV